MMLMFVEEEVAGLRRRLKLIEHVLCTRVLHLTPDEFERYLASIEAAAKEKPAQVAPGGPS